jgi:hypothetical protein
VPGQGQQPREGLKRPGALLPLDQLPAQGARQIGRDGPARRPPNDGADARRPVLTVGCRPWPAHTGDRTTGPTRRTARSPRTEQYELSGSPSPPQCGGTSPVLPILRAITRTARSVRATPATPAPPFGRHMRSTTGPRRNRTGRTPTDAGVTKTRDSAPTAGRCPGRLAPGGAVGITSRRGIPRGYSRGGPRKERTR